MEINFLIFTFIAPDLHVFFRKHFIGFYFAEKRMREESRTNILIFSRIIFKTARFKALRF